MVVTNGEMLLASSGWRLLNTLHAEWGLQPSPTLPNTPWLTSKTEQQRKANTCPVHVTHTQQRSWQRQSFRLGPKDEQLHQPGEVRAKPWTEKSRQVPSVLGGRGGRLRAAAEDAKDSKPAGHGLEGPVPLPAFRDHFHHRHDVRVGEGRVKVQGLQNRNQNADDGHGAHRPESRKRNGAQPPRPCRAKRPVQRTRGDKGSSKVAASKSQLLTLECQLAGTWGPALLLP